MRRRKGGVGKMRRRRGVKGSEEGIGEERRSGGVGKKRRERGIRESGEGIEKRGEGRRGGESLRNFIFDKRNSKAKRRNTNK